MPRKKASKSTSKPPVPSSQITLVYGNEVLLRSQAIERIRTSRAPEDTRAFDETILTAGENNIADMVTALRTQPVQAEGRLIWVRQAERFKAGDITELENQSAGWVTRNHLLLEAGALRSNSALVRIAKGGEVIVCEPLKGGALVAWVRQALRSQNVVVDGRVPQLLIDRLGSNLAELDQAIERMAIFSNGEKVSEDHAADLIGQDRGETLFELTDAFGKKDGAEALRHVHRMMTQGRRIPEIIGLLFWQLKQLTTALEFVQLKQTANDLARALKRHPFYAEKLIQKARRFNRAELDRKLDLIAQADLQTKSTGLESRIVLESLVLRLCESV